MSRARRPVETSSICELRLVNGSLGDPGLFVDYLGRNDALLFDTGENGTLHVRKLADLEAVFLSHHHVDHFVGFDRILRANLDAKKILHVYGPPETIDRIYRRITSYSFPYFPFQQLILRCCEVHPDRLVTAELSCPKHFPPPKPITQPWNGPTIHENDVLRVEAAHLDHTVPCLGFALVEKPGYHPDRQKLDDGFLKPGPWIGQALARLRDGADLDETLTIDGGTFTLENLVEVYFVKRPETKVTYIVDTAWSEQSQPALIDLARRSRVLFCDSFYLEAHAKSAEKHRHMTAARAATLAKQAKVGQLVLIHFSNRYRGQEHKLLDEARAIFPATTAVLGDDDRRFQ